MRPLEAYQQRIALAAIVVIYGATLLISDGLRFEPFGHTPGAIDLVDREENPQFPSTLDLRRSHT